MFARGWSSAYALRAHVRWYAGGMKKPTREARVAIKAFDKEEEAWRRAALAEGMNLSTWARRALDRAAEREALQRKQNERWY